jgi:hypothetical protein
VLHHRGPRRSPCDRGRAAVVSSPPLAGALPNSATATNRLGVSPTAPPCRLLPWSGPTSPPANAPPPPPQGHSCEIQGHMSELGTCLQRKLSWFLYQLVQRIRKSLENCRNSENCKTNFVGFVLMNTTTFVIPTSSDSGYF